MSMALILLALSMTGFAGAVYAEPVVATQSRSTPVIDPFASFVHEAAQRFGVPAPWISAVLTAESGGDEGAVSPQGAMGLMQIMPATWADLRARYGLGSDPFEPRDNILAGAAYLREMHDRYGSPGFLAAYNAGPARYEEHLTTGRELPAETQIYVAILTPMIGEVQVGGTAGITRRVTPWLESPLFATLVQGNFLARPLSALTPSQGTPVGRLIGAMPALAPQADGLFVHQASTARSP
ncbi:MAG: hypothetical protein BGN99_12350 [Alphaproteobacteria bacterium 65-37]|nr:MAG: hypothetical protein BGN99_12350 [Alphaproteobacteria bacterium 65-37]